MTTCLVAGYMNSLTDVRDADYTPVWSKNEKTAMRLEQDLVDEWEFLNAWPLTRSSEELREGYTQSHVQPEGGGAVGRRIDCIYVPLRWVGAMARLG